MLDMTFENTIAFAQKLDQTDELSDYRNQFHIPKQENGEDILYFCGNSLGLQPRRTLDHILQELTDWANLGVEGHFHAKNPWMPYHELLTPSLAKLVGAEQNEVVAMNTLSVNLHLMMVSFYQPTNTRYKIVIESDAFPSDKYAVESQLMFHGYDPKEALIRVFPREGETLIRHEDIESLLEREGQSVALIMLGGVNYYTGQLFDIKRITRAAHAQGCKVGFDLAHAAGNVSLNLHDDGPDFAAWCSYKYINSGPGCLGACFIHNRHASDLSLKRFAGWWGHDKETRFNMRHEFNPIPGAEGWQLSNPPIFSLAAMRASLSLFDEIGMSKLREKSLRLTGYFEYLLNNLNDDRIGVITPLDPAQRGCQLSIQVKSADKKLHTYLTENGIITDWREPDVVRAAPVPLYNSFMDVYQFVQVLKIELQKL
jgi:kynureninase